MSPERIAAEPPAAASSALEVYPSPDGVALSRDFSVHVRNPAGDWRSVPVYAIQVDEIANHVHTARDSSLAYFDFSGTVEISITYHRGAVRSARVRPRALGIGVKVRDNTISFGLSEPRNLSVEINDDIFGNLHLFANPIETSRPDPTDPDVIYFGPGLHVLPEEVRPSRQAQAGMTGRAAVSPGAGPRRMERRALRVSSGKTVYVSGGAVLRGRIICDRVENVRVIGRGMIEQGGRGAGIRIANAQNIEVSGIFTPQCFTGGSRHVVIAGVKCISYVGNGDGMNVISSSDVLIDGVFNRNSDDCITVYGTRLGFTGGASRITVRHSTLWADVAHPILVGTHGSTPNPEVLEDLRFQNIDILDHSEAQLDYQGCLALNAGDSNLIRNVRFENIRIEDFRRGQLLNVRVFFNSKYCTSPGRGVEDVVFRNIDYSGTRAEPSVIAGYDETRKVRNVVFENLRINGVHISDQMPKPEWFKTTDMARIFIGDHVEGVEFRATDR